jgi:general secretion pathway protein G
MAIFVLTESGTRCLAVAAENDGRRSLFGMTGSGFTLIEVMICVCIIGVLSAIATPFYIAYRERARVAVAIVDMKLIETALTSYVADNGALPDTLTQAGLAGRRDPWGNPYRYLRIDGANLKGKGKQRKDHFMVPVNSDYDLYSMGPDGKSQSPFTAKASRDDIVRAYNGGYYGKVSDI